MTLNDICVFVPCWFGVIASLVTGALAAECSSSRNAAPFAAVVMAVLPAHIMRSVGGGYVQIFLICWMLDSKHDDIYSGRL